MPFSGTGVFVRVYQWVQDAANGIFVDATRTDTDSNDIAAGLTNCVTRDGQSPWTANIPAGGFKITGLANGVNTTDSVNFTQVFNNPSFVTPNATTSPATSDNSLRLATTAMVQQVAFNTALPAQSLGFLGSNGTVAAFGRSFSGYAVDESKGTNVASAATIDLQNTTVTGNFIHITGTTTITAITLPAGAERTLVFDGILTLTNSANLDLPGAANITTAVGDRLIVRGEGSGAVRVISYIKANGQPVVVLNDSEVIVHTANGRGSTNTAIRRFTTTLSSVGTAITYADSATLGGSFTINENGIYSISYADTADGSSTYFIGVSVNSAQLTTAIESITAANRLIATETSLSVTAMCAATVKLSAGDVVRAHVLPGSTVGGSSPAENFFRIRKVANQ